MVPTDLFFSPILWGGVDWWGIHKKTKPNLATNLGEKQNSFETPSYTGDMEEAMV
jgi:hypothetical protein